MLRPMTPRPTKPTTTAVLSDIRGRQLTERAVAPEKCLLARLLRHLAPIDEHMLDRRRELERIARPHHDIRILACLERAITVGNAPQPCRVDRHGTQRGFPRHAV